VTQQPDTQPGNYYVSVRRDDGDFRCLVGPFRDDHAAALALVDKARTVAETLDPKAWLGTATGRCAPPTITTNPGSSTTGS
jgi:hypothetical protein